jgi:hypothetical protein
MKTFKITYHFDGNGEALIKAKNENEAKNFFAIEKVANRKEWGEEYDVEEITEVK